MLYSRNADKIFALLITVVCIILYFLPTGFPDQQDAYERNKAKVIAVDNQNIHQRGVVQTGVQGVTMEIAEGPFAGQNVETTNPLLGKLEMDKIFQAGDVALVVSKSEAGRTVTANLIDHYRINVEVVLLCLFVLVLFWYARWTGVKAILSFVFTTIRLSL